MATTSQVIRNGQSIAAPSGEKELRLGTANPQKIGFLVTSGTMQVTTDQRGAQDVISAAVAAFANTVNPVYMSISPNSGDETYGRNLFIKGSGTILIFW